MIGAWTRRGLLALACASALFAGIAATADAAPKLRTMTYNVHGNLGTQDGTYSGAAIASVISAQNPDVVGLQEVCASQLTDLRAGCSLPATPTRSTT